MAGNVIEELRNLYEEDQLILFVGAGVSINSNAPSWNKLTEQFQRELGMKKIKNEESCQDYSFNDHVSSAQYLYNQNREKYFEILKKTFSERLEPNDLSRKVMDLNQSDIVTTNYDGLLEESESYTLSQYDVIKDDGDLLNSQKKKKIIKMHGDANCLESIVLKESDYLNYENDKKAIHTYLKHLFFSKTILFIGYGLDDYNVKQILNDIQNYSNQLTGKENRRKHYFAIYKSKEEKDKRREELLEEELRRKNVILVDVAEYEELNYKTNLTHLRGIANYNFLCEIENYTLESLSESKLKAEVIERFKQLNEQSYVSTNDILNVLEVRENLNIVKSTSNILAIYNENIFNVLCSEDFGILNVLKKTMLKEIHYYQKETYYEAIKVYKVPNYKENYMYIQKKVLDRKLNNIYVESIATRINYWYNESSLQKKDLFLFYNKDDETNGLFSEMRKQVNNIIVTNINLVTITSEDDQPEKTYQMTRDLTIKQKMKFIEYSLSHKEKRQFGELRKIGNFEYSNYQSYYYKLINEIKRESKRESGLSFSNKNTFGELDKMVQGIYLYPLLNDVASLIYKGDFHLVIKEYATAYLVLFNTKYMELEERDGYNNKLFPNFKLSLLDIMFISEFIETKHLLEIVQENDIKKIEIDFDKDTLYKFLEEYCIELNKIEPSIFTKQNYFVKNILFFLALIDKVYLNRISQMALPVEFKINYIGFCLKYFKFEKTNYEVDVFFYNHLFLEVFGNSEGIETTAIQKLDLYNNFKLILKNSLKLISEENREVLIDELNRYKNRKNIPKWVFDFMSILGKERVLSKFELSELEYSSLLELIRNNCLLITEDILSLVEEKIMEYVRDNREIWYRVILEFSGITNYEYSSYIWDIVSNIDMECSRIIYNIVHSGSLVEMKKLDFREVELIRSFLANNELRKKINVEKINSELKEMEELGLTVRAEYYLRGVVDMYRSNHLEN